MIPAKFREACQTFPTDILSKRLQTILDMQAWFTKGASTAEDRAFVEGILPAMAPLLKGSFERLFGASYTVTLPEADDDEPSLSLSLLVRKQDVSDRSARVSWYFGDALTVAPQTRCALATYESNGLVDEGYTFTSFASRGAELVTEVNDDFIDFLKDGVFPQHYEEPFST